MCLEVPVSTRQETGQVLSGGQRRWAVGELWCANLQVADSLVQEGGLECQNISYVVCVGPAHGRCDARPARHA
eukprot:4740710-Prorocentrum_lima.AAC.1